MFIAVPLAQRIKYDLIFILFLSPLIVYAGSKFEPPRKLIPAAALIGDMSYALYAIHIPVAHACQFVARKAGLSNMAVAPAYLLTALCLSWLCVRWIDLPLRRGLRRMQFSKKIPERTAPETH